VNNSSGSPGSACIKGSIPSLGAFYGAGNAASVQIREIDGAPVKPEGWRSHCVAAGNHQIGFLADSADQYRGFRVVDYVALELAPSSKYVLRGDFEGINLILHVLKVGGASPVLIQDLSFKISDRVEPTPVFVAVPIPAHH
jgi:hypothetical protein